VTGAAALAKHPKIAAAAQAETRCASPVNGEYFNVVLTAIHAATLMAPHLETS